MFWQYQFSSNPTIDITHQIVVARQGMQGVSYKGELGRFDCPKRSSTCAACIRRLNVTRPSTMTRGDRLADLFSEHEVEQQEEAGEAEENLSFLNLSGPW
jgi:hypothetical protein